MQCGSARWRVCRLLRRRGKPCALELYLGTHHCFLGCSEPLRRPSQSALGASGIRAEAMESSRCPLPACPVSHTHSCRGTRPGSCHPAPTGQCLIVHETSCTFYQIKGKAVKGSLPSHRPHSREGLAQDSPFPACGTEERPLPTTHGRQQVPARPSAGGSAPSPKGVFFNKSLANFNTRIQRSNK